MGGFFTQVSSILLSHSNQVEVRREQKIIASFLIILQNKCYKLGLQKIIMHHFFISTPKPQI